MRMRTRDEAAPISEPRWFQSQRRPGSVITRPREGDARAVAACGPTIGFHWALADYGDPGAPHSALIALLWVYYDSTRVGQ